VVDVAVTNCVISSHASALKFGTASRGAFNRIVISNCVVKPSTSGNAPPEPVGGRHHGIACPAPMARH
jgi:polygalacturonase